MDKKFRYFIIEYGVLFEVYQSFFRGNKWCQRKLICSCSTRELAELFVKDQQRKEESR